MKIMTWQTSSSLLTTGKIALILASAQLLSGQCLADTGAKYTMNINIDGTIVANGTCTFNKGGNLTLDFGEVRLLAGANNSVTMEGDYRRPIAAAIKCSGDSAGLLQMKLSNVGGSYKDYNGIQVLDTDNGIVGLELLVNGAAQSMGTWFSLDPASPPSLEAQVVQTGTTNSKNVVSGDTFTASGTLTMAFN